MEYFKIGDIDFSQYVNELKVQTDTNYNAQTNAAGNTVVDFINTKRVIEVGIIPLDSSAMVSLQNAISPFSVAISYRNPITGALVENLACIIPSNEVEYYTIQVHKVKFKALKLKFIEL